WPELPYPIQQAWFEFLEARPGQLPGTSETVLSKLGRPIPTAVARSSIDALIHRLNAVLRRGAIDSSLAEEGVSLVQDELRRIRANAARGSYSMGGVNVADVAAGLVIGADAEELWPDLADFLLDSAVQREDRTPAFERLARADRHPSAEI